MTSFGYGPHPAQTLTWRMFWYYWAVGTLRRVQERNEAQAWSLYLALLEVNPKGADVKLREMQRANERSEEQLLADLCADLPPSVRVLIAPPAPPVTGAASGIEWFRRQIEQYAPDDPRRAFWEAGLRAAQERQQGAVVA